MTNVPISSVKFDALYLNASTATVLLVTLYAKSLCVAQNAKVLLQFARLSVKSLSVIGSAIDPSIAPSPNVL